MPWSKNVTIGFTATTGDAAATPTDPVGVADVMSVTAIVDYGKPNPVGVTDAADAVLTLGGGGAIVDYGKPNPVGVTDVVTVESTSVPAGGWNRLEYGSIDSLFDAFNTTLGGRLRLRRFYQGDWPAAPSSAETSDFARGILPWVSFNSPNANTINSGAYDARLAAYWGASTQKKLVTWVHEVDTGSKPADQGGAANWCTAFKRIMTIKRANCPNNAEVLFGPVLTGYAFSPFSNGNYQNFMIPGYMDFIGTDPYNFWRPVYSPTTTQPAPWTDPKCQSRPDKNCVDRPFEWLMGDAMQWSIANAGGIPWGVGEYSCHPDPNDTARKPAWMQAAHDYMSANNFIAATMFSGRYGESGPWWMDRFHTFSPSENDAVRFDGPTDTATINKIKALIDSVG